MGYGDTHTSGWSDQKQQFSLKLLIFDGTISSINALFACGHCADDTLSCSLLPQLPNLHMLMQSLTRELPAVLLMAGVARPRLSEEDPICKLPAPCGTWKYPVRSLQGENAQGR